MIKKGITLLLLAFLCGCSANSAATGAGAGIVAGTTAWALGMRPQDAAALGAGVGAAVGIGTEIYDRNSCEY